MRGARKRRRCANTSRNSARVRRRKCPRSSIPSKSAWAEASSLFAIETDGQRRVALGHAPETDESFALDLHAVTAHEQLLAAFSLHERAIRGLIDQHELVAIDLDARMQARDQVAADHEVVVVGAADRDVRTL